MVCPSLVDDITRQYGVRAMLHLSDPALSDAKLKALTSDCSRYMALVSP
jgi:hypothetical protein